MPKSRSVKELRDWVAAAQSGDKEAFSEVVKRCQDMAYGIAYAMLGDAGLAQDAAQEAFIAAYLNLAALREPAAFPGWFRRVVIKHSDRERRSLKASHPLDESVVPAASLPDPMRVLEASEKKSEIHRAIAELPATQRHHHPFLSSRLFPEGNSGFPGAPGQYDQEALVYGPKKTQREARDDVRDANPV